MNTCNIMAAKAAMTFNNLPKASRFILCLIVFSTLAISIWRLSLDKSVELEKKEMLFRLEPHDSIDQNLQEKVIIRDEIEEKDNLESYIHEYTIVARDTLSNILSQYGIDILDISQLIASDKDLCNLKIGQQLYWTLNKRGKLKHLIWRLSQHKIRIYDRIDNGFKISSNIQRGDWVISVLRGTVNSNFISSAKYAGLTNEEINTVIKAMQWQMDFHKLKKGDSFSVLMSYEIIDGRREQSQIVGAYLRSGGRDYYAIRAEDGKFYDRNGTGLIKGFLRFPTEKRFRVSSNFNLNRLNPVTRRITPHLGVDFAMLQGTPVIAVSDGEVIVAKYNSAAGYYVTIKHSKAYTTRYMHLYKLLVKRGQKVRRGDRIAFSGNTGRSTGPHLHYEVWINKQAVNPMTVRLPHTEELTGKNRREYLAQVREIIPKLKFE